MNFHFIFSFSEIKRERETEKESERKTLREGRTAGGSNEYRCTGAEAERSAISDDRSTIYENFISFIHFNEIKRDRLRESQREKERNTLREGRREHQSRGRAICDEGRAMTTTTSELRRCDHGLLGLVCWGLVLVCVLGIFFFFFLINTSVFGLLEFVLLLLCIDSIGV